eukprot:scaffold12170_cov180-Isochrysis_galbana.AAC.2
MSRKSDWNLENPEGCCSGQLFAVVVNGGCCDSLRGLCCTHNPCQEPELWLLDRQSASSALCRLRASNRAASGRKIMPVVSSVRC